MSEQHIVIFTDGAAKGNPGPGGWGAIVATPDGGVTELGGGARHTTNNRMELTGVIAALRHVRGTPGEVALYTDSTYVIRGITQWVHVWRRRGWKTADKKDVLNREYWETLLELVAARGPAGAIHWRHLPGHAGIPGNERADAIATAFAAGRPAALFTGRRDDYEIGIDEIPDAGAAARVQERGSRRRSGPGYAYVSVVGGQPMRHATWAECERRVKGRPGARFKKAMSAAEEASILRSWGFDPEDF